MKFLDYVVPAAKAVVKMALQKDIQTIDAVVKTSATVIAENPAVTPEVTTASRASFVMANLQQLKAKAIKRADEEMKEFFDEHRTLPWLPQGWENFFEEEARDVVIKGADKALEELVLARLAKFGL